MDGDVSAQGRAQSGYSACDYPQSFTWEGETLTVCRILREWREPGAKYYLIASEDGRRFRLTFHEASGRWSALEALPN
jgi:hypothetical protein